MISKPCFRFTTVVWGAAFTDAFLKVALPSLLTPGNLVEFAARTDSLYRIYTTPEDAPAVSGSKAFHKLAEIMPVELATVRGISYVGKYRSMTQCHADFVRSFAKDPCAFFFIFPDVVWADGAFNRLLEIHKLGKRMVAVTTPRLSKETFVPAFLKQYGDDGLTRPITPRQLVRLALDHLHPVTRSQFWNPAENTGTEPGDMFWKVDEGAFLARAFSLQPLMVRPVDRQAVPVVAIDADYTAKVCPDFSDIHIVTDSDELCCLDFTSSADRKEFIVPGAQTVHEVAKAMSYLTNERHRQFVKSRIRLHCNEPSEKWSEVERRSDRVVEEILSLMKPVNEPPPKISRARFLSPGFWKTKLRQKGAIGVCKQVKSRLAHPVIRKILGDQIKVNLVSGNGFGDKK